MLTPKKFKRSVNNAIRRAKASPTGRANVKARRNFIKYMDNVLANLKLSPSPNSPIKKSKH